MTLRREVRKQVITDKNRRYVPWSSPHIELSQPLVLAVSPLIWNKTDVNKHKMNNIRRVNLAF